MCAWIQVYIFYILNRSRLILGKLNYKTPIFKREVNETGKNMIKGKGTLHVCVLNAHTIL